MLKCYIHSFDNIIEGNEYFCEVKTVDALKGQFSNITTDNLLMETFDLKLRNQEEALEIILYQNEKTGKYKFSKEIKRIKYDINFNDLGEKNINGIKFTLSLKNQNIDFPRHPPFINPKRYIHIYVDRCVDLPIMDNNGLSDPFITISLNDNSQKRYSDVTRVIFMELNPVFKHTFHIPVYSLRDDKIIIKCFDYDKIKQRPELRFRKPGDLIAVAPGQHKKLKDWFIDEKIPARERDRIPLVTDGKVVLWVLGHRMSADHKVTEETRTVLEITIDIKYGRG
jgi:tRNA(Ile)-lysidine synthetase-like protein